MLSDPASRDTLWIPADPKQKKIMKATDQICGIFWKPHGANFTGHSASSRSKVNRLLWMSTDPNVLHFCKFPHAQLYFHFYEWPEIKIQVTVVKAQRSKFILDFLHIQKWNSLHFQWTPTVPNLLAIWQPIFCFAFLAISYPLISTADSFLNSVIRDIFINTSFISAVICQVFGNKNVNNGRVSNIWNWTMPTILPLSDPWTSW